MGAWKSPEDDEKDTMRQVALETKKLLDLTNLAWMTKMSQFVDGSARPFTDGTQIFDFERQIKVLTGSYLVGDKESFKLALHVMGFYKVAKHFEAHDWVEQFETPQERDEWHRAVRMGLGIEDTSGLPDFPSE